MDDSAEGIRRGCGTSIHSGEGPVVRLSPLGEMQGMRRIRMPTRPAVPGWQKQNIPLNFFAPLNYGILDQDRLQKGDEYEGWDALV